MKIKKTLLVILLFATIIPTRSQDLQIHYDFRHWVDPKLNSKNFPMVSFQYFKNIDTVGTGSFLFKFQSFLSGKKGNNSQTFLQLSQTLRFWKPKLYMNLSYTGGLGIAPPNYGYYLTNSFGIGIAYPFQWKGSWVSVSGNYRYNAFEKASHDIQLTLYMGRSFAHYKIFVEGSIVAWTENRDQGIEFTHRLKGKKFAFFGDPQVWIRVRNGLSIGSRVSLFYHLLSENDVVQAYPTIGLKQKF
jgi:hypothetical protein